ncbi:MAG: hypothetical protein IKN43_01545, partial [Selenomonadaceae bacterium]|nr:hypothetical protein [Selenomonadaceae bacterium]
LDFRMKGQFAQIAGTRLEVPINANIAEFEEGAAAIFAASVGVGLALNVENLTFPPLYKEEIYNWKRIAITVSIAAALLFGLTFAFDGVRLYCAEKEVDAIEKEAQNFVADKTRMRLFNEIADDANLRAKVIAEKTEKRLPLYGVLTHLGTLTEEGVIVKSVKMREKFLEIECEALSNRAMEAFLENLSERRDLYISSPTNLKTDENNRMRFSFSVDLRGK